MPVIIRVISNIAFMVLIIIGIITIVMISIMIIIMIIVMMGTIMIMKVILSKTNAAILRFRILFSKRNTCVLEIYCDFEWRKRQRFPLLQLTMLGDPVAVGISLITGIKEQKKVENEI